MFFKKYKEEIENLEYWKEYYKKQCNEYLATINKLSQEKIDLNNKIKEKEEENKILKKLEEENKIMKKYYKINEEPSEEVQAKILTDLRLHDMEFKMIQQRLENIISLQQINNLYCFYNRSNILPYFSYY